MAGSAFGKQLVSGRADVAVEIALGNTAEEIQAKIGLYLEEGAAEVWVIYPKPRVLMVFTRDHVLRLTGQYRCDLFGVRIEVPTLLG
jgi:hypothetical protein